MIDDFLNMEFSKVFGNSDIHHQVFESNSRHQWSAAVTVQDVYTTLRRLDTSKSGGSDGLTPFLLRSASDVLCEPITHLICLSIEQGKVPKQWKEANIVPIPKDKNVTLSNLRPISLLPVITKILERVVLNSVKDRVLNLYGPDQHGFRPGHSTLTSHLSMQEHNFIIRQQTFKRSSHPDL